MLIKVRELAKFIKGAVITRSLMDKLSNATLNGKSEVVISEEEYSELLLRQKQYVQREEEWAKLTKLKSKAQSLEKQGKLLQAKQAYEVLIRFASNSITLKYPTNYGHDVNRFRIVCNKLKLKEDYLSLIDELKLHV